MPCSPPAALITCHIEKLFSFHSCLYFLKVRLYYCLLLFNIEGGSSVMLIKYDFADVLMRKSKQGHADCHLLQVIK